nr:asparagine synthase-related protein [Motiliproteus sediminis]
MSAAFDQINQPSSPVCLCPPTVMMPSLGQHGVLHAAVWGQITDAEGKTVTADQLCKRAETEGDKLLAQLRGHYALLLWDAHNRWSWLCADRFATRRLYYCVVDGRLWVADNLQTLRRALPTPVSIRPQALVDYLFFHMIPSPETLYEGVFTLAPAEYLVCTSNGQERRRHWHPRLGQVSNAGERELGQQLFSTLDTAVGNLGAGENVGCFLSGGLDSSSIAGLLARHRQKTPAFSIGFPLEQYNELDYARCAVDRFSLDGHEYIMQPQDVVDALPTIVASMGQPFGNSSVLPTYFCARLAKDQGIEKLVAGDGGDELFAGNERYAHQLKLERWRQRLGPLVGLLDVALLKMPWPDRPSLLAKGKSFARQLKMTIPENLEYYNFFNLIDRQSLFSAEIAAQADLKGPDRRCQALFDQLDGGDALDRMLFMDWKHTLADNDLVKVTSMCQLAGVDVVYPMLDDRLVDFSLQVPASLKLTPTNLRHLYKQAMTGFLPDKIIHKSKHGFGLPFGLWTQEHPGLRSLAYDALDTLPRFGFFNRAFIDEVKRLHQQEHAKHYGELVWVLMVLAIWLNEYAD